MYYEEKIINGVLMFRTTPDGKWTQCSIEKMNERIVELLQEVKDLKSTHDAAIRKATEQGYDSGKYYERCRMRELLGLKE